MKQVKTKSGLTGWQGKLRKQYSSFEEFVGYCEIYANHTRLGYETPEDAWEANPTTQGSVRPSDYRIVKAK